MAELPRQLCRIQGKPPEYTPSQLEGLKALVPHTTSRIRSTKPGESSIITHPDYHEVNQSQTVYIFKIQFQFPKSLTLLLQLVN